MAADSVYACDAHWFDAYAGELAGAGLDLWTQSLPSVSRHPALRLNWVLGVERPGLGLDCIHYGGNSGYQAINLAYIWGARRMLLLGFDNKLGEGGKVHWFGGHPKHKEPRFNDPGPGSFQSWAPKYARLAQDLRLLGVEVINCTPGSALTCFKGGSIDNY